MKSNTSGRVRSIFVHLVLIFLSFLCLFFFYILIVNATRSHADLQKGFSALPGKYFLENLKNVANDGDAMDGMISGSKESYIPIFVISRKNPIAVTCVGITRIAIIKVKAAFFILKS